MPIRREAGDDVAQAVEADPAGEDLDDRRDRPHQQLVELAGPDQLARATRCPRRRASPTPSVMKIRAYMVTTCQKVQPLTSGMRWKIVQMKRKPAIWIEHGREHEHDEVRLVGQDRLHLLAQQRK